MPNPKTQKSQTKYQKKTLKHPSMLADLVDRETGDIIAPVEIKQLNASGDHYFQYITDFLKKTTGMWKGASQTVLIDLANRMNRGNRIAVSVSETARLNHISRPTVIAALKFLEEQDLIRPVDLDSGLRHYYMINPWAISKVGPDNINALRQSWGQLHPAAPIAEAQIAILEDDRTEINKQIAALQKRRDDIDTKLDRLKQGMKKEPSAGTDDSSKPTSNTQNTPND